MEIGNKRCSRCCWYYGYDCEGINYCRADKKPEIIEGYDTGINCDKFYDVMEEE